MSEDIIDSESSPFDFRVSGIATDPDPLSATFGDNTIDLAFEIDIGDDDVLVLSYTRTTGSINDTATNTLENFSGFTVTNELDTTRPTPTVSNGDISLTNQSPLPFTVRFDESVTGLAENEITVNGPARVVTNSLAPVNTTHYNFDVERTDSDGEITVFLAQGAAVDGAQNPSRTSNTVVFTFDTTVPVVTGDSIPDSNTIVLEISEDVTGGNEADFTISGVNSNPGITSIVVSGTTITLNLNNAITGTDTPAVTYAASAGTVTDPAENPLAGFTRTISNEADDTSPTIISFTTTSSNPTRVSTITYDVVFSEPVTFDSVSGISVTGTSGAAANTPTGSGASHTFTVTRGTTDGTVIVSLSEGAARDDAGNDSEASDEITITIDTERPVPTLTANATSPTNSAAIQYTVDFGEDVDEFVASDIGVSARGISLAVPSIVEVSAGVYDFTISHGINEGDVTALVLEGAARDNAGNINTASTQSSITIDRIPPEVDSAFVQDARTVRLVMSEDIIDSESSPFDFRVSGIATDPDPLSATFGDNTIDLAFEIDIGDDDVLVLSYTRTTGSINDTATNTLENFSGFTVTNELDTTRPTPTVSNGDISLTNQSPLPFTVRFDESVTGLAENEITVNGPARVVTNSLAPVNTTHYNFDVERTDSDGEITVFLAQGAAVDGAQNPSRTSNTVVFTFDTTVPVVTGDSIPDSNTIVLEISEDVTGGNEADFTISGVNSNPGITSIVVSGTTITLNLNNAITGTDTPAVTYAASAGTVTDPAENPLAGFTRTISNEADDTSPTIISFTTTSSNPTRVSTITYDVVFSEPVTFDSVSGISVTGTSGAAANTPTGSGASHTFTVTRGTTDGTVIVSLSEGAARDDAGNDSEASDEITITIDTERPVPTLTANATSPTNSAAIQYTVDFGEDVDEFVASDIGVSARGISLAVPSIVEVSAGVYDFTISHGINEGDVTALVLEGAARDNAGNINTASTQSSITIDRIPPEVDSAFVQDARTVRLVMSEDIIDSESSPFDFRVSGIATDPDPLSATFGDNTIDLAFEIDIGDDDVLVLSYTRTTGSINDTATNTLENFSGFTVTNELDTTRPTPTVSNGDISLTNQSPLPFTVRFDESVTGLAENEITVNGPARVVTNSLAPVNTTHYNFDVERTDSDGEITVFLAQGAAVDGAQNPSRTSNTVVFTFDTTVPVVTGDSIPDSNTIVLEISEDVTGGNEADFTISGVNSNPGITSIVVSGTTITLNLNNAITGTDTPAVTYAASAGTVTDPAENPLAGFTRTISNEADDTSPTIISFTTTSSNPTRVSTITYDVVFSEPVTFDSVSGISVTGTSGAAANTPTGSGASHTFTVTRGTTDGTVIVSLSEGAARDDAGNDSEASDEITITIDTERPVPTLTANATSPTNSAAIQYTVDFGEDVDEFVASDIGVSARGISLAVPSIVEVSAGVYDFTISHGINEGDVTALVLEGAARDNAGNINTASTQSSITIDRIPPEVDSAFVQDARTVRLVMSEDIIDSESSPFDFRVSGIATDPDPLSATFGDNTIDLAFEIDIGDDDVLVLSYTRTTGSINDTATNTLENFSGFTVTNDLDTTRPTPTVSNGDISLTNQSPLPFTVRFDESVTGLAENEITVNGPARVVTNSLAPVNTTHYNFDVERTDSDGEITVFLAQGAAVDGAQNPSRTSNTVVFTFDTTVPVVTGDSIPDSNTIVLEISEDVTGGNEADFTISGVNSNPGITSIVVSGTTITLNLNNAITGTDTPAVTYAASAGTVTDPAENPLAGFTRTISNEADDTSPTIISFTTTSSNPTRVSTITYDVVFSEPVTFDSVSGISVTGTSGAAANTPTGSGASHTFTVTRGTTDGTVIVSLSEGAARDDAGNDSEASDEITITIDTERPVPTLTANATSPTNSAAIQYTVDFGEDVDEFVASDIGVSARGISLAVPSIVEVSAGVYDFTISHGINEGDVTALVLEGAARDNAGNINTASTQSSITIDRIPPEVDSAFVQDARTVRLVMSEPVSETGDLSFDFTVFGIKSGGQVESVEVSGSMIDITVNRNMVETDSLTVTYVAQFGSINDTATNPLADFANQIVTNDIDNTPPTIISFETTSSNFTNSQTVTYTVEFSESVTGFDMSGISVTGTSGATATIPEGDGASYTFDVNRGDTDGTVTASILAGAARDDAGNDSEASDPVTVTIDTIPPVVDTASVLDATTIRLVMSEPVIDDGDLSFDFTVFGISTGGQVESVEVSGSMIDITVNRNIVETDSLTVTYVARFGSINDTATNPLADFEDEPVTNDIDNTAPVPTVSNGNIDLTNREIIPFTVRFDEPVTGFNATGIKVSGLAGVQEHTFVPANATVYNFNIQAAEDGEVTVSVVAGAARDGQENPSVASNPVRFTIDTAPPTLTLASTESGDTRLRTIPVNATFSERVDDFGADDIIIVGSATAGAPTTNDNIMYMLQLM